MTKLDMMTALLIGVSLAVASAAPGEQPPLPAGCAQIVAVLDQGGGALSPEEVAKKTGADVATVRDCTDLWRRRMKDAKAPQGANATPQPVTVPQGCAQIVALLDQGGGALSAEEVAKKTGTDIATVRDCTDLWRRTMKGGAHP